MNTHDFIAHHQDDATSADAELCRNHSCPSLHSGVVLLRRTLLRRRVFWQTNWPSNDVVKHVYEIYSPKRRPKTRQNNDRWSPQSLIHRPIFPPHAQTHNQPARAVIISISIIIGLCDVGVTVQHKTDDVIDLAIVEWTIWMGWNVGL